MTTTAIADDTCVVECRRNPTVGRMTIVTIVAARKVRWVLTCCDSAVMAGGAGANDLGMIYRHRWLKERCVMAIFADVASQYVILILPCRIGSIVTTNAVARNVQVIECRWNPAIGRMTVVAGVTACDVRRVLACCRCAVVTGRARTNYLCVIYPIGGREHHRVMAVVASIASRYMVEVFTNRIRTIVTAEAITRDIGVVKVCRYPGCRRMAIITGITTGNVRWIFSCRNCAVMA